MRSVSHRVVLLLIAVVQWIIVDKSSSYKLSSFRFRSPNAATVSVVKSNYNPVTSVVRRSSALENDLEVEPLQRTREEGKAYNGRRQYEAIGAGGLALDDFNNLLEGIYIFRQAFGDLDIPLKFEIPANEPWPTELHGLRLGKRLEKLFTSSEFFERHPDKVQEIKKLGLEPNVRSLIDDWELIERSMKIYKGVHGNLRISSKFVVPDEEPWPRLTRNLKLGIRVAAIRSAGRYVKDHPERKEVLDEMGFEWRLRDHTHSQQVGEEQFQQVYEALKFYKEHINLELNVPVAYTVPSEGPWPVELHRLKLGALVQGIKEEDKLVFGHSDRVKKLTELGFPWDETSRSIYSKKRFDLIYSAMVCYKEKFGDLFVPQNFIVPSEPDWPEGTWELKLGARVNAIRSQGTFVASNPERREKLDQLDFSWELPSEIRRRKKNEIQEGEALGEKKGSDGENQGVPADASRYSMDQWKDMNSDGGSFSSYLSSNAEGDGSGSAEDGVGRSGKNAMDGSQLGSGMPSTNPITMRIQKMRLPGRVTGVAKSVLPYTASRTFEANSYREVAAGALRDHMLSREFSPDPEVRQLSHFEGHLQPEAFCNAISKGIPIEGQEYMKRVGYRVVEFGPFDWESVLAALKIYKSIHGNVDVPWRYDINEEIIEQNIGFDSSFEKLKLGEAVAGLRIGDIDGYEDLERRAELDALGFEWNYYLRPGVDTARCNFKDRYQRFRFYPMLQGLRIYHHLHGFAFVEDDFVVPVSPQWPLWMHNMPLGEWSCACRIQQKLLKAHYGHRVNMLNNLEFIWWIAPAEDFRSSGLRGTPAMGTVYWEPMS